MRLRVARAGRFPEDSPQPRRGYMEPAERFDIGWREWVALPDLGLPAIKAKVDTGARTSALHAWKIESFTDGGAPWVRFHMHPLQRRRDFSVACTVPVRDRRLVSDSGGHREQRYVIATTLELGGKRWSIETTLTDRDTMLFRMLLGRQAIGGLCVVAGSSFLTSAPLTRAEAAARYRHRQA